ncbi:MAG: urate hydroxylase PuuD [Chloroflexi bacterium]|nr:urate hydroxylase PuuD [Chloroflexota bacterium]
MAPTDWFLLLVRWLHLLAAVSWVGGSIFFFAVLRPALQSAPQDSTLSRIAGQEFRSLVDVAISVLLVTGVILSVARLTSGSAGVAYGVVLGAKITLALWMFALVWFRQRRRPLAERLPPPDGQPLRRLASTLSANNLVLALGLAILLLADLLGALFEQALAG